MKKSWFVYSREEVLGPFTDQEVRDTLSVGLISEDGRIWAPGLSQWIRISAWLTEADPEALCRKVETPTEAKWYYVYEGASVGPLTRRDLLERLEKIDDVKAVLLWTPGLPNWLPIFEFYDLMDELNLNRREFVRVNTSGEVYIEDQEKVVKARLMTLGAGGLGMQPSFNLHIGDQIGIRIVCDVFPQPLRVKCEVRYITPQSFAGLKFLNLNAEAYSRIVKFVESGLESERSAA